MGVLQTVALSDLNTPHKLSQWLSVLGKDEQSCDAVTNFVFENQMVGSSFMSFSEKDFRAMSSSICAGQQDEQVAMDHHSWALEHLKAARCVNEKTHDNEQLQWVGDAWKKYQVFCRTE